MGALAVLLSLISSASIRDVRGLADVGNSCSKNDIPRLLKKRKCRRAAGFKYVHMPNVLGMPKVVLNTNSKSVGAHQISSGGVKSAIVNTRASNSKYSNELSHIRLLLTHDPPKLLELRQDTQSIYKNNEDGGKHVDILEGPDHNLMPLEYYTVLVGISWQRSQELRVFSLDLISTTNDQDLFKRLQKAWKQNRRWKHPWSRVKDIRYVKVFAFTSPLYLRSLLI